MDNQLLLVDSVSNDFEAKQRLECFRFGNGPPSSNNGHRPAHTRSRSRNMSISSLSSLSSLSVPPPKLSSPLSEDANQRDSLPGQGLTPSTRRNSHHHRRSSVSTRHESAEMMGVPAPDLPPSSSEDNVNFGDKDSIRRRALWALEGKPDVSFSKVEIPELSSPQAEKFISDPTTKASFPPGLPNHLANKRDSFKLLSSTSSTKDQLHTLVEEDEEEEEAVSPILRHITMPTNPPPAVPLLHNNEQLTLKPASNRPRPASLNLRPLSLIPERLSNQVPSISTAMPVPRSGLKPLSLGNSEDATSLASREQRRWSSNVPSLSHNTTSSFSEDTRAKRRSSICYKSSTTVAIHQAGLPTPEMSPSYTDQHFSLTDYVKASSEDEFFLYNSARSRPFSTTEQQFFLKSHNALLARITDLEKALSMKVSPGMAHSRTGNRPTSLASELSFASDQSSATLGEPSDEMLQLIADLKAERDEYKHDVDAWRGRVNDMENRLATVTKRVEVERREAWIARSKVGLLEVEKASLEKKIDCVEEALIVMGDEKEKLQLENRKLQDGILRAHADLAGLQHQLSKAKQDIEELTQLRSAHLLPTPDSSDDDDIFAGLEESDSSFHTSSSDSVEDPPELDKVEPSMLQSPPSTPDTIKVHAPKHSLRTWTFPTGAQPVAEPPNVESDVDKFFGCLEGEDDGPNNAMLSDSEYSYERSKGLFSAALKAYEDDQHTPLAAFPGLGVESEGTLPVVIEEVEDCALLNVDGEMFQEAGGICITLTPAKEEEDGDLDDHTSTSPTSSFGPPVLPPLKFNSFEHEAEGVAGSISFEFRYDVSEPSATESGSSTPKTAPTNSSPSSMPRLRTLHKNGSSKSVTKDTPSCTRNLPSTPPTKRIGISPSSIPQAVTSPSPIRNANPRLRPHIPMSTLIRLPQPKQYSSVPINSQQDCPNVTNENDPTKNDSALVVNDTSSITSPISASRHPITTRTTGEHHDSNLFLSPNSAFLLPPHPINCSPATAVKSTVTPSRFSWQSLTNLVPSWASRANKPLAGSPTRTVKLGNNNHSTFQPPAMPLIPRKYVSKETQLEKLRLRLQSEDLGDVIKPLHIQCKHCRSRPILL